MMITYQRLDGSMFEGPLFHPRMEVASVLDPRDGTVKTFKTLFDTDSSIPLIRVELKVDENGNFQE